MRRTIPMYRKIMILLSCAAACTVMSTSIVHAQEAATPVRAPQVSLYSDVKAARIGDVITVLISESNTASKSAQTSTRKQDTTEAEGEATTGALSGLFPGLGGSMDISNRSTGQGSTTRSGSFTSQISVRVIEVLPSGDLVIEGTKTMEINEDTEVITLSGVVRPQDIASGNTIYSYQIANAKFTYKGKGSVSQGHRPGILVRFINWIL